MNYEFFEELFGKKKKEEDIAASLGLGTPIEGLKQKEPNFNWSQENEHPWYIGELPSNEEFFNPDNPYMSPELKDAVLPDEFSRIVASNPGTGVSKNTDSGTPPPPKKGFWEQFGEGMNMSNQLSGASMDLGDRLFMAGASGNKGVMAAGIGSSLIGGARQFASGLAFGKENRRVYDEYNKRIKRAQENNYQYVENGGQIRIFEDGGYFLLDPEKEATGEYITTLPKQLEYMANAEVEKDEYIITPENQMKKVVGERHEKGGVKQFLQEGTRVVSDNLKIGKDLSKVVKNRTGVKVGANKTYAKTIDAYSDKIGLTKLVKQIEEVHKQLKENLHYKDEQTRKINEQFLTKRLQELENKKKPLEDKRLAFSNAIFNAQEFQKELPSYRRGGTHVSPAVSALAKKHGISIEDAMSLISKYEQGGMEGEMQQEQEPVVMINPETNETVEITTQQEFEEYSRMGFVLLEELVAAQQDMMQGQQMEQEEEMFRGGGKKNYSYYGNGGVFRMTTPGEEKPIEISVDNDEDFKALQEYLKVIGEKGKRTDTKEYRDALKGLIEIGEKYKKGVEMSKYLAGVKEGKDTSVDKQKFENRHINTEYVLEEAAPKSPEEKLRDKMEERAADKPANTEIDKFKLDDEWKKRASKIYAPMPMNLPPDPMVGHAMTRFSPEKIDAVAMRENIAPLLNQQDNIMQNLGDIPLGQRAALASTIGANTSDAINKQITEVERYNAINAQQTEQQNVALSNAAQEFRAREIPRYEALSLTALAKTQNDFHNWFATQDKNRIAKHQYLTNYQLIDGMFDNAYYDPATGKIEIDAKNMDFRYLMNPQTQTKKQTNKKQDTKED